MQNPSDSDADVDLLRDHNYQLAVNNWNNIIVTVFKKVKKTQQTSIEEFTVIQLYFYCNIHYGRDAWIILAAGSQLNLLSS